MHEYGMKVQYPVIKFQGTVCSTALLFLKSLHNHLVVAVTRQVGTQPGGIGRDLHRNEFRYLYRLRKEKPCPVPRSLAAHDAQDNQQNGDKH